MNEHKRQKLAGWLMIGGAIGMIILEIISNRFSEFRLLEAGLVPAFILWTGIKVMHGRISMLLSVLASILGIWVLLNIVFYPLFLIFSWLYFGWGTLFQFLLVITGTAIVIGIHLSVWPRARAWLVSFVRRKHKRLGRIGLTLLVLAFFAGTIAINIDDSDVSLVLTIIAAPFGLFGTLLFVSSRRANTSILSDKDIDAVSNPILYLRPFKKDSSLLRQSLAALLFPPNLLINLLVSLEEHLARALRPLGSLVAIGKPGEMLPGAGASKLYMGDDWKIKVENLIKRSKFVVVRAGWSEGLLWELEKCVELLRPERFLILLGKMSKREYNAFAKIMQNHTNIQIPPFEKRIGKFGASLGFIGFDENWNGSFLFEKPPYFRQGFKAVEHFFNYSLKPVFDRLGVQWSPSPVSIARVSGVIGLALMILFFVILFLQA